VQVNENVNRMERADKADLIRWWDALDQLAGSYSPTNIPLGLRLARRCQHPDAQWLSSLFPDSDSAVTKDEMLRVMQGQGEDLRAMHIRGSLLRCDDFAKDLLQRAAELGYAPAQAAMAAPGAKSLFSGRSGRRRRATEEDCCGLGNVCGKETAAPKTE
jgi:hypothetical protein